MGTLLNETQVAEIIGLTVHWLRRKRWAGGGIPFIKIADNGAVRYRQEDIEKFLNARVQSSTSDVRRS